MYPQEMIDPPYEEPELVGECPVCGGEIYKGEVCYDAGDGTIVCSEECEQKHNGVKRLIAKKEPFDVDGYLADLAYEERVDKELRGA